MQVSFTYHEITGDYNVDAEVNGNRVQIVSITDDYNQDIDIEDFSSSEKQAMISIALREYHNMMNDDVDDSPLDDDDGDSAAY